MTSTKFTLPRHCEEHSDEAIQRASQTELDCFAAVERQFILGDAAGGVEGLAMTGGAHA